MRPDSEESTRRGSRLFGTVARLVAPFVGLLVVMALFSLISLDLPLGPKDLRLIVVQMATVGIAAMGMTFVIVSGGIDLSVGSTVALSGVAAALALKTGWGVTGAVLTAVLTGGLCGLYNGLLITLLRLPPFIATLATMGFFRGVAKWISGSTSVRPGSTGGMEDWVFPFPASIYFSPATWMMIALAIVLSFALRSSLLGRHTTAIGSSEPTARLCGIRVQRTKVSIYILCGLLCGLAGLLQFARLTEGDPTVAVGLELKVIAAVVIGGASLSGGQGSLVGTLVGAFLMTYLGNRCTALEWPNYVEEIIVGHVIIIAVALDQWRRRR